MLCHIPDAAGYHREALLRLLPAQPLDELHQTVVEGARKELLPEAFDDVFVDLKHVVCVERHPSGHHRKHHDAKCPPIHSSIVAGLLQRLGRQVVRGAAYRVRLSDDHLGDAQVGDLAVALVVDENVLELDVAVDDLLGMDVVDPEGHASCEEGGLVFAAVPIQVCIESEQLASKSWLHQQVDAIHILVRGDQPHDKGRV
mmetsp:Transcript_92670/g.265619  ORF Transcript_92670/g.265619 Transcript_92670/m.265619 type:complete len:200 (-) Transcript_92670:1198-1797(-)